MDVLTVTGMMLRGGGCSSGPRAGHVDVLIPFVLYMPESPRADSVPQATVQCIHLRFSVRSTLVKKNLQKVNETYLESVQLELKNSYIRK